MASREFCPQWEIWQRCVLCVAFHTLKIYNSLYKGGNQKDGAKVLNFILPNKD